MKYKNKIIFFLFIIIIIFIIFVININFKNYFYKLNSNSILNSKEDGKRNNIMVYENKDLHIRLRYSEKWSLQETINCNKYSQFTSKCLELSRDDNTIMISIEGFDENKTSVLSGFMNKDEVEILKLKNGEQFIRYKNEWLFDLNGRRIFPTGFVKSINGDIVDFVQSKIHKGKIYTISILFVDDKNDYIQEMDKILETLEFI